MNRIVALLLFALACITPSAALAASAKDQPRQVGVLSPFITSDNLLFETLRQEMTKFGYTENKGVIYHYRAAENFDALNKHAAEMARLKVDLIVTEGSQGARAARNATGTIPIIMANVGDAVDQGFASTLAKPGGNLTGISSLNTELSGKRLELLKDTVPTLSRVAVMREAVGDASPVRVIENVAHALSLKVLVFQVREGDEIASAFGAMTASHVGAVEVLPASLFVSRMRTIVGSTVDAHLPAIFPDARFVRNGGLMSYGPDVVELYKRASVYVDKILKGAKPNELPVEQPTAFELVLNLKAAQSLGITVPPGVLMRVNRVIR